MKGFSLPPRILGVQEESVDGKPGPERSWLPLALLLLAAALAGLLVAWWLRPAPPASCQPQRYDVAPQPGTFAVRALEAMSPIARQAPVLEAQSPACREAMEQAGLRLRRARVRQVVFVQGTFVGHDPTQLLAALQGPLSALGPGLMPSLQRLSKLPSDRAQPWRPGARPAHAARLQCPPPRGPLLPVGPGGRAPSAHRQRIVSDE